MESKVKLYTYLLHQYGEKVYDKWGHEYCTEIEEVDTLPNISWCGNGPEGYRGKGKGRSYKENSRILFSRRLFCQSV